MNPIVPPVDDRIINRNPKFLHPVFFKRIQLLIAGCTAKGLSFGIFEGYRSPVRQAELYASSRTVKGPKLTNAPAWQSFHQYGLAVDLVWDKDPVRAGYQWSWDNRDAYLSMAEVAGNVGLESAAKWKKLPEFPHVQITYGFRESELREMYNFHQNLTGLWLEMDAGTSTGVFNG